VYECATIYNSLLAFRPLQIVRARDGDVHSVVYLHIVSSLAPDFVQALTKHLERFLPNNVVVTTNQLLEDHYEGGRVGQLLEYAHQVRTP